MEGIHEKLGPLFPYGPQHAKIVDTRLGLVRRLAVPLLVVLLENGDRGVRHVDYGECAVPVHIRHGDVERVAVVPDQVLEGVGGEGSAFRKETLLRLKIGGISDVFGRRQEKAFDDGSLEEVLVDVEGDEVQNTVIGVFDNSGHQNGLGLRGRERGDVAI